MIFQGFNLVDRTTVLKNVLMGRLHEVPTWRTLIGQVPAGRHRHRRSSPRSGSRSSKRPTPGRRISPVDSANESASPEHWPRSRSIILADEPVASLDPPTSHVVMSYLQQISRELGITTIVNLHFLDLATAYADRIIGLRDGVLVFDGPGSECDDERVREHLRTQPHRRRHDGQAGRALSALPAWPTADERRSMHGPDRLPRHCPTSRSICVRDRRRDRRDRRSRRHRTQRRLLASPDLVTNLCRKNSVVEGLLAPGLGSDLVAPVALGVHRNTAAGRARHRGRVRPSHCRSPCGRPRSATRTAGSARSSAVSTTSSGRSPTCCGRCCSSRRRHRCAQRSARAVLLLARRHDQAHLRHARRHRHGPDRGGQCGRRESRRRCCAPPSCRRSCRRTRRSCSTTSSSTSGRRPCSASSAPAASAPASSSSGTRRTWEELWGLVFMFFLVVFVVERISVTLRRRLV